MLSSATVWANRLRPNIRLEESHDPRLDSPLLCPALRGGYMNLHNWRERALS